MHQILQGRSIGPFEIVFPENLVFFLTGNSQTSKCFKILVYRDINCRIIYGYCNILVFGIVKNLMKMRTKDRRLKQVQLCPTLYCNTSYRLITQLLGILIKGLKSAPQLEISMYCYEFVSKSVHYWYQLPWNFEFAKTH